MNKICIQTDKAERLTIVTALLSELETAARKIVNKDGQGFKRSLLFVINW
jgi:hypothetical protein